MKAEIALLSILCLFVAVTSAQSDTAAFGSDDEDGIVTLEGNDTLSIPNFSVLQGTNQSHLYNSMPVYAENQSIRGTFSRPSSQTGAGIMVRLSSFNVSDLANSLQRKSDPGRAGLDGSRINLNHSGDASFALNGKASGFYTLLVTEENSSRVLFATPLLVTKSAVALELPARLKAGDALKMKVSASPAGNLSRAYAGLIIRHQEYDDASILISSRGPEETPNTTLTLAGKSVQVPGTPKISDLLINAFTLLPRNSAAGLQESNDEEVELQLVTDAQWEKGSYILICFVYSPDEGLVGAKQETVEVI